MNSIIDFWEYYLAAFLCGTIVAFLFYRNRDTDSAKRISDLVWIALGGFGVITTILLSDYSQDSQSLSRSYSETVRSYVALSETATNFYEDNCSQEFSMNLRDRDSLNVLCLSAVGQMSKLYTSDFFRVANVLAAPEINASGKRAKNCQSVPGLWINHHCEVFRSTFKVTGVLSLEALTNVASGKTIASPRYIDRVEPESQTSGTSFGVPKSTIESLLFGYEQQALNDYKYLYSEAQLLNTNFEKMLTSYSELESQSYKLKLRLVAIIALMLSLPFRVLKSAADFPKIKEYFDKATKQRQQ